MKYDVVCFGSGLVDIFVETDVHDNGRIMCYNVGAKIQIQNLNFEIGGGGVNTASSFSKMGLKTGFFGNIGSDEMALKILEKLKKNKISFLGNKNGRTGYSIILDSKEHDRTILTFKGDNDNAKLKSNIVTKWWYFSSLAKNSFKAQLKIARSKKYKIAFNPSLYLFKEENVKEILPHIEILILNKEEADMIDKTHKNILNFGPKILIVTDGKNPFYCYTSENRYLVYPHMNVKVVERTGAGDAFASAFVASYIKNKDIEKSLRIALANSESVVTKKGSTNGILNFLQALEVIKKNPAKIEKLK